MRPFRLVGLLVPGLLTAAAAFGAGGPAPGLVEIVGRFEKLQVANESAPVANLKLTSEHLECVLVGRAGYVKAGDEVVGLYFQGIGTMEYLSVDPIEAPVVAYVARKSTGLTPEKTAKGLRVKDRFTSLLWIAAGQEIPQLQGLSPLPLTAAFQAHREKFLRKRGTRLSLPFAEQRLNDPTAPLVWVEMDGGTEDLIYVRTGALNPGEHLLFLHGSRSGEAQFKDALFAATLSGQPIGWDRRDPPRPRFVLTDVDLEVKASDGKDVKLTVVETIVPQKTALKVLAFELQGTVYTTLGEHLSTRTEHLRKVTDEQGRGLSFEHAADQLLVELAEPAEPDHPLKLRFEIDGDFLVQPGGSDFWELGVWSWFPQPELCEQYYTFHAVVRVKKPFVPFASGRTIRRVQEGDENVLETRLEDPVQFAVILAGKYDFKEEVRDGVTIRVATYAIKNDRAVKQLTDLAATIIGFYKEFLGPFPFPEFNVIEIDDYGFGQAPPGVMFITKEVFNPLGGTEENQLFSGGANERFAHEIAHQYWGHVVKMPSHEEQWLTESFAEYSAALFLKAGKGEATYKSLVSHWKGRAQFVTDQVPIPLANRAYVANDARSQFLLRVGLLYDKGPYLLAALHRELGDDAFFTFMKSYQKSFRWKFGSTKTVQGLLQFMTKKDYGPFFEQNYWGIGMPKN
jgi:hypothetical protein